MCNVTAGLSVTGLSRESLPNAFTQTIMEKIAGCHGGALTVLNSYWVGKDSSCKLFEVTLIGLFNRASWKKS